MLSSSGNNLLRNTERFLASNKEITLFSAYIKLETLKKINSRKNIKQIIVRWEVKDLCLGVSDIELYRYCIDNNIVLFRNTRIHLKAIWDNRTTLFYGSANITGKGIGEQGLYNFELCGLSRDLSLEDRLYLNKILKSSELVDERLYFKLKSIKESIDFSPPTFPKSPTLPSINDKFLLSQLPMSISPIHLIICSSNQELLTEEDEACMLHDIANFELDITLNREEMERQLSNRFNKHPFILALKNEIMTKESKSLNYGGVVRWIQKNTTTVPTPRSWDMKKKKIVNILYEWICHFDKNFYWNIPGKKSQVIHYKKN